MQKNVLPGDDNFAACINKLKRARQRLISGQSVQPTALLPIRHYITSLEHGRRLGLFVLAAIVNDDDFCQLSSDERLAIQTLFTACNEYVARPATCFKAALEKATEAIVDLQPGSKRIGIHATRRKVNHHFLLAAEYCGYIFTRDWTGTWLYEASIAYVFGYQRYRYVAEQYTVNRLSGIVDYIASGLTVPEY